MENSKSNFIKLTEIQCVDNKYNKPGPNDRTYHYEIYKPFFIRLDSINEVHHFTGEYIWNSNQEFECRRSLIEDGVFTLESRLGSFAKICKSTGDGHGINGTTWYCYIDEESYQRLYKALGLADADI